MAQTLNSLFITEQSLIINKVTAIFSVTPFKSISYTLHALPTEVFRFMRWGLLALGLSLILLPAPTTCSENQLESRILELQHEWARIKYLTPEKEQESQMSRLLKRARAIHSTHAGAAKAILWEAIILYTYAGEKGGFSALGMIIGSKDLLLEVVRIDPSTQNGFAYTALGNLYARVPGPPIAFGSDRRAKKYLQAGIKENPAGLDSNYFMGAFLMQKRRYARAAEYLRGAIAASPRPQRPVADAGRKSDAKRLLKRAEQQINRFRR